MGGARERGRATTRPRCCSRPRTSSRSGSCARPSGSACAPRARTAGRRASTRISPEPAAVLASRLLVDLAGARADGRRRRPRGASRSGRSFASAPSAPTGSSASRSRRTSSATILERLGFDVGDDWDVTVPTWRARDVTREIDLVEEVARVVLDRVPHTMPLRRAVAGHLTRSSGCGASSRTCSSAPASARRTRGASSRPIRDPDAIRLPDPMSGDQAILRTTLLDGLIAAAVGGTSTPATTTSRASCSPTWRSGEQCRRSAGASAGRGFEAARGAVEVSTSIAPCEPRRTRRGRSSTPARRRHGGGLARRAPLPPPRGPGGRARPRRGVGAKPSPSAPRRDVTRSLRRSRPGRSARSGRHAEVEREPR